MYGCCIAVLQYGILRGKPELVKVELPPVAVALHIFCVSKRLNSCKTAVEDELVMDVVDISVSHWLIDPLASLHWWLVEQDTG